MGNRGCLHDENQTIVRYYRGKGWIICLTEYKGKRLEVMAPGENTQIFFLDEATGLAAGHRPCSTCQHDKFNAFQQHWGAANADLVGTDKPLAPAIDAHLHQERLPRERYPVPVSGGQRVLFEQHARSLPTGCFVVLEQHPYLVLQREGLLLPWSPEGYDRAQAIAVPDQPVQVLTPQSVVRALEHGYQDVVFLHSSAQE